MGLNLLGKKPEEILQSPEFKRMNLSQKLRASARFGFLEGVIYAIENGANINMDEGYALRWAAQNGHTRIVRYLIKNHANPFYREDQALFWAVSKDNLNILEILLKLGSRIDKSRFIGDSVLTMNSANWPTPISTEGIELIQKIQYTRARTHTLTRWITKLKVFIHTRTLKFWIYKIKQ